MSVWSDMGLVGGEMRGVNPGAFLNTALGFFQELRLRTKGTTPYRGWNFDGLKKENLSLLNSRYGSGHNFNVWGLFTLTGGGYPEILCRPITENFWRTAPEWTRISGLSEADVLGEEIVEKLWYNYSTQTYNGRRSMEPAWALQRYRLIQKMRYVTVPIDYGDGVFEYEHFFWDSIAGYRLRFALPSYWAQSGVDCRIGIKAETLDLSRPAPPIEGCFWVNGSEFVAGEAAAFSGQASKILVCGAVDLATHPDFARYFDVN